jgi:hypothetical protein
VLDGTGAGGMAGAPGESRVPPGHTGHRVRNRPVSLEKAERGAGRRRLSQQEGGQSPEGEAAGAESLEHQGLR